MYVHFIFLISDVDSNPSDESTEIGDDSTVVIEVQCPMTAAPREARANKHDLHRKWSTVQDAESETPQFLGPDLGAGRAT